MASEGMNLGLAIYAGAIAWVSMALLGVNRRFLDQHSRFWFGLHRIVSAGGGVVGAWIFAREISQAHLPGANSRQTNPWIGDRRAHHIFIEQVIQSK